MSLRPHLAAASIGAAIVILVITLVEAPTSAPTPVLAVAPDASPSEPIVAELPPLLNDPLPSTGPAAAAPVATLPPAGDVRGPGDSAKPASGPVGPAAASPDGAASATSATTLAGLAVLIVIALTSLVGGIVVAGRGR